MAKAKSIMIQGTASNAGKSLLCAGLCRVFARKGLRVAPFKSQNMALNSFVTRNGLEMGRAQVMQAECAGTEPDVRMNPILLKPTSDSGSQVILNGEILGNMEAKDYYTRKKDLRGPVREAYESLAADYDLIVLEGAGSPAEINLKDQDLVNMGMAHMAQSPVLLVGDIDRGGVFASLAGTHLLFEPWERDLLKGIIINKFRGDVGLLQPGLRMLENKIDTPILGVVPYIDVDVDDEDSLSSRLETRANDHLIDIAVIRLPHLSNFTDFNSFSTIPGVGVRYITRKSDVGQPDLLILPGTKSTMADLAWLRQTGLEGEIQRHAAQGKTVFGICGGYQMLGRSLSDPEGAEGGGEMPGIGLLPVDTIFHADKTRRQVSGHFNSLTGPLAALSGLPLEGYEIHMGKGRIDSNTAPLVTLTEQADSIPDGTFSGSVYGCYIHGIFDQSAVSRTLVQSLASAKGVSLETVEVIDWKVYREQQYDRLADSLEESLDLQAIEQIIKEGVAL